MPKKKTLKSSSTADVRDRRKATTTTMESLPDEFLLSPISSTSIPIKDLPSVVPVEELDDETLLFMTPTGIYHTTKTGEILSTRDVGLRDVSSLGSAKLRH